MSDADIAQARRYYMHVQEGGTLTARDVGRMVEAMEVMQAKLAQQGNLVQAAVAAALREAAADIRQWGSLFCGSEDVTDEVANDILALIPEDAQAALDRVVAAERERCAKVAQDYAETIKSQMDGSDDEAFYAQNYAAHIAIAIAAAIRKGGE